MQSDVQVSPPLHEIIDPGHNEGHLLSRFLADHGLNVADPETLAVVEDAVERGFWRSDWFFVIINPASIFERDRSLVYVDEDGVRYNFIEARWDVDANLIIRTRFTFPGKEDRPVEIDRFASDLRFMTGRPFHGLSVVA